MGSVGNWDVHFRCVLLISDNTLMYTEVEIEGTSFKWSDSYQYHEILGVSKTQETIKVSKSQLLLSDI